jgi:hypothetical protein
MLRTWCENTGGFVEITSSRVVLTEPLPEHGNGGVGGVGNGNEGNTSLTSSSGGKS